MTYQFSVESFEATLPELMPLYRAHYAEMCDRLEGQGMPQPPFAPRLSQYIQADRGGWLITIVLRDEFSAVGYANVYLTQSMHNGELIAQEDAIFVSRAHRNGVGKKLVEFGLQELKSRGVKRLLVSAVTDLRVAKLWKRMGFQEVATQMAYVF